MLLSEVTEQGLSLYPGLPVTSSHKQGCPKLPAHLFLRALGVITLELYFFVNLKAFCGNVY